MMVLHTQGTSALVEDEDVVLCMMNVRATIASTFWDSGSSSNFVRGKFAKVCRFKGRSQTLSVTTLSGKVVDYLTVTQYTCTIFEESGKAFTFKAYGLDSIYRICILIISCFA